jgi:2-keto-4-pentenoate hydratase/2-oxohepta-3-ene-1,7-dioic acid hydratase in catechol pathway
MDLPVDSVGNFVAIGGGFQSHLEEQARSYRWPDLWVVPDTAIIPEGEPIRIPEKTAKIKPGAELTAVIGEEIANASEDEAWDAIKGFTISNDVTASGAWPGWSDPDHENITGVGYKIQPTFAPLRTEFVPKADLADLGDLEITVHVDGELSVEGSTAMLAFSIRELVSFVSQIVPLSENDVVALGDPGNPAKYLDDASSVTCAIKSIGELTNPVTRTDQ